MIKRITVGEWLKRYDNMTEDERLKLAERVGEWLERQAPILTPKTEEPLARVQDVMQMSGAWSTEEQEAFMEGVKLMTSFARATDTWLPEAIYKKSVKRSVLHIIDVLTAFRPKLTVVPASVAPQKPVPSDAAQSSPEATPKRRGRGRPPKEKSAKVENPSPSDKILSQDAKNVAQNTKLLTTDLNTIVPRPKHIDQYIHLLPEDTQKRAAQYGALMNDLGTARTNMRLLLDDPQSTAVERERWAKAAVKIDNRIAALRKKLDDEWGRVVATGHVVLDDLGMAHLVDPQTGKVADPKPKVTIPTDDKKGTKPKRSHHKKTESEKAMTDEEKKKRISYLQKWLRDPRPEATAERKKQWGLNIKELIALGGRVTKSIIKAGEHYGVKMPKGV